MSSSERPPASNEAAHHNPSTYLQAQVKHLHEDGTFTFRDQLYVVTERLGPAMALPVVVRFDPEDMNVLYVLAINGDISAVAVLQPRFL